LSQRDRGGSGSYGSAQGSLGASVGNAGSLTSYSEARIDAPLAAGFFDAPEDPEPAMPLPLLDAGGLLKNSPP